MQTTEEALLEADGSGAAAPVSPGIDEAANGGSSGELRELLRALQAMRVGDFSVRMAGDQVGIMGKVADTFNEIVAANQCMAKQLERVGHVVGREGKTRQRVRFGISSGAWGEMESSVNTLIDDLLWPTTEVARTIAAVAQGDLLQTVQLDVDGRPLKGEFLRAAEIVNTMIKQLNVFTSEVTRVAREVGTEGKLGGQAQVVKVTGVWKELTESVNSMADNLTAALAAGQMGSWDWDIVKNDWIWDEGQYRIFGVDPATFAVNLENLKDLVHPEDWGRMRASVLAVSRDERTHQSEFRIRRPNGEVCWCIGTTTLTFDADGRIGRLGGVTIDITDRKEAEEHQALLAREVDHRARNALAVIQSIVRLTRAKSIDEYKGAVEGRITALARAHTLLSESRWHGADLRTLVSEELAPYRAVHGAKIVTSGPAVSLQPAVAQTLALALHELATNAAKYGALSVDGGTLALTWEAQPKTLSLEWKESGGPPVPHPAPRGFGMKLISTSIDQQLSGNTMFDWGATGLHCTISIPLMKSGGAPIASVPKCSEAEAPKLPAGLFRPRVLLVEDEALVAMMMQEFLNSSGCLVVGPFTTAAAALSAADNQDFDFAILDVNLGNEVVYPVADVLVWRGLPFIFITGYDIDSIDPRFKMVPILQKPISKESLHKIFAAQPSEIAESQAANSGGKVVTRLRRAKSVPLPADPSKATV